MVIYIKNMVCDRCKMAVKFELTKLGLKSTHIELGEIGIDGDLSADKKDTLSKKEKKEIAAIEKELSEMSLERKKKKNGQYEYIIQDNVGKLMYKVNVINESFENGRQIGDGFYEFTIKRKIPNYKLDGYKVIVDNKSNELVKMTNKTIFSNTGDQMLNGIKNVISYNFEKGYFLLELDLAFFLIFEKDFEKRFNLPKKYDLKKQKLRCVIDKDREYIVKPTFDAIPFN